MINRKEVRPPRLLRLKDAAKYLAISAGSLRRLVQQGELPVIKLCGDGNSPWLIDQVDLDEFVERSKTRL